MINLTFRKLLIDNPYKINLGHMNYEYVTIHNTNNKATAYNERQNLNRKENTTTTGFHISVDKDEFIQCMLLTSIAHHAGDGKRGIGNTKSIGIEITQYKDIKTGFIDWVSYEKAEKNAVFVSAYLLFIKGLKIDRLKRHYDWSSKICPENMYEKGSWLKWTKFKLEVEKMLQQFEKLKKDVEELSSKVKEIPPPKWFTDEFPFYKTYINQEMGTLDFWRCCAITFRTFQERY